MPRTDDVYKGLRFIVDTIAADDGRFGYQAVVDGKRPIIGAPCANQDQAMAAGVAAAKAKIDSVLESYRAHR